MSHPVNGDQRIEIQLGRLILQSIAKAADGACLIETGSDHSDVATKHRIKIRHNVDCLKLLWVVPSPTHLDAHCLVARHEQPNGLEPRLHHHSRLKTLAIQPRRFMRNEHRVGEVQRSQ
jgi:hypothetical protein